MKVHRRARALNTLTKALHKPDITWPQNVLSMVLMPITMGFVTGAHSKKAETAALLQVGMNYESLTSECLRLVILDTFDSLAVDLQFAL